MMLMKGADDDDNDKKNNTTNNKNEDVFRKARARKINSTPGHSELYRVVNTETAKHLAQTPLYLPDLGAVIAESR